MKLRIKSGLKAFLVKVNNKVIDVVYFPLHMDVYQIKKHLVHFEKYNERIIIYPRSY